MASSERPSSPIAVSHAERKASPPWGRDNAIMSDFSVRGESKTSSLEPRKEGVCQNGTSTVYNEHLVTIWVYACILHPCTRSRPLATCFKMGLVTRRRVELDTWSTSHHFFSAPLRPSILDSRHIAKLMPHSRKGRGVQRQTRLQTHCWRGGSGTIQEYRATMGLALNRNSEVRGGDTRSNHRCDI
jgi:hypothetical protein